MTDTPTKAAMKAAGHVQECYTDALNDKNDMPTVVELARLIDETLGLGDAIERLEAIRDKMGRFSRDPVQHANNCIDDASEHASIILARLTGDTDAK